MTTLARTHPLPDTPGIRDLRLLTGPDAGDLLAAALQPAGGRLLSWRAVQVEHRSGRGVTAAYQVRIGWPGGHTSQERLGARTGPTPDAALVLQDGVDQVAVWRFPHDPYLPALGAAYDEASLARLLGQFGFGGPVRRQVRAYRPCRRAVIEATGGHGRLFVKVVRPNRVEALHRRHRLLVDAGLPTPPSLGYTPDGLLVLQALPGPTLRHILQHRGGPAPSAGDPGPARSVTGPAGRRSPPGVVAGQGPALRGRVGRRPAWSQRPVGDTRDLCWSGEPRGTQAPSARPRLDGQGVRAAAGRTGDGPSRLHVPGALLPPVPRGVRRDPVQLPDDPAD